MSKKIGIEIGTFKTKIVLVKVSKLKTEVIKHKIIDTVENVFNHDGDVNVLKMEEPIHEALKEMKISGGQLNFAINHESVIIRTRKLPYSDEDALENLVRFEAESFLPYDISEFNIDYKVLSIDESVEDTGENEEISPLKTPEPKKFLQNVMIVAAPKQLVEQYAELAKRLKLKLKVLTVYTEAMARYLNFYALKENKNILFVDLGQSFVNMLMYSKFEYFANIRSHYGVEYLADQMVRMGNYSEEEIMAILFSTSSIKHEEEMGKAIESGYDTIVSEISKMIEFFKSREFGTFVDEIQLFGGGSGLVGFKAYLENSLNVKVNYLETPPASKLMTKETFQSIVPAVGVCMEVVKNKL